MKSYDELYKMRIRGDASAEVAMYALKSGLELPYSAVQLSNRVLLTDVLRERLAAEDAAMFTMKDFANLCGTPGCALGTYAASSQQDAFELQPRCQLLFVKGKSITTSYDSVYTQEHFGLDGYALNSMFTGCGRGSWTLLQALDNIINVLDAHWATEAFEVNT